MHIRLAKLDLVLLACVLCTAIFFRFYQQGVVPPGMDFDEAFESLEAHRIVTTPGYHPVFFSGNNGVPPVEIYLTALAYRLAGEQMLASRYVSAIAGTATVLALYLLVRRMFPLMAKPGDPLSPAVRRWLPFAAALILAVLPWHTAFSRRGIEVVLLPLWAILAIYFLWQGLETERRWHFALSGAFWGSALYTYQAGAFLPGVLVLFLIYSELRDRRFLAHHGRHLLLLAIVAALVLVPLLLYATQHMETFTHRGGQVTLLTKGRGSETPLLSLAGNLRKVAGLFVVGGDINAADNLTGRAPIPLALAAALLIGLLVALRRAGRPAYALLAIWFLWMLQPTILTEDAPSIRRAIGSTPPLAILSAVGISSVCEVVLRWAGGRHGSPDKSLDPAIISYPREESPLLGRETLAPHGAAVRCSAGGARVRVARVSVRPETPPVADTCQGPPGADPPRLRRGGRGSGISLGEVRGDRPGLRARPGRTEPEARCGQGSPLRSIRVRGTPTAATWLVSVCAAALLIYMVVWSYQYYFLDFGQGKDLFHWFDQGLVEMGQYAAATPADTRLYYTPAGDGNVVHLPLTYQLRERDLRTFDGEHGLVLPPSGSQRSLYLIKTYLGDSWTLPALQEIYPTGQVVQQVTNRYGTVDSLVFAVAPGALPSIRPQNQVTANFANQVELLGSSFSSSTPHPGEDLTVTLFLRSLSGPTPASHTVFTHLVGSVNPATGSPVWAGHDQPPLYNAYPTTRWDQGEIIIDRHTFAIPADVPAGSYQIEVGLYTPAAGGARLPVVDANGKALADGIMVGSVMVKSK